MARFLSSTANHLPNRKFDLGRMRERAYDGITVTYEELAEVAGKVIEMQQNKIQALTRELESYRGVVHEALAVPYVLADPQPAADNSSGGGESSTRRNSFAYDGDF